MDKPSEGRKFSTAMELFGHLLDMGQYETAMNVLQLQIQVEGSENDE